MSDFISRQGMAERLQVSPDTLRGWQDRHWEKGVQYIVIGKTTMLDAREVEKWLESRKVSSKGQAVYASISDGRASASRKLIQADAITLT